MIRETIASGTWKRFSDRKALTLGIFWGIDMYQWYQWYVMQWDVLFPATIASFTCTKCFWDDRPEPSILIHVEQFTVDMKSLLTATCFLSSDNYPIKCRDFHRDTRNEASVFWRLFPPCSQNINYLRPSAKKKMSFIVNSTAWPFRMFHAGERQEKELISKIWNATDTDLDKTANVCQFRTSLDDIECRNTEGAESMFQHCFIINVTDMFQWYCLFYFKQSPHASQYMYMSTESKSKTYLAYLHSSQNHLFEKNLKHW